MAENYKEKIVGKVLQSKDLTALEKRYLEALVRADRDVIMMCPKCGFEMQHPPTRKMELLRDYHDAVKMRDRAAAAYKEQQDNIRRLGTLRTEITREPDLKKRLALCIQAISVMTGDNVFRRTELRRLEQKEQCEND